MADGIAKSKEQRVLEAVIKGPVLTSDFPGMRLPDIVRNVNKRLMPEGRWIVGRKVKLQNTKWVAHCQMQYQLESFDAKGGDPVGKPKKPGGGKPKPC